MHASQSLQASLPCEQPVKWEPLAVDGWMATGREQMVQLPQTDQQLVDSRISSSIELGLQDALRGL